MTDFIEVIHPKGKFKITKNKIGQGVERLEKIVKSNTLVLVQDYVFRGLQAWAPPFKYRNYLFFSDGYSSRRGFSVNNGLVLVDWQKEPCFEKYDIEKLKSKSVKIPVTTSQEHYNEGTFSPAGGESWTNYQTSGTKRIIIRSITLKRSYVAAVAKLKSA